MRRIGLLLPQVLRIEFGTKRFKYTILDANKNVTTVKRLINALWYIANHCHTGDNSTLSMVVTHYNNLRSIETLLACLYPLLPQDLTALPLCSGACRP